MNTKKLLFLGLLFSSMALQALPQLKVLSWNIDTNIGKAEEGFARDTFPEWRVGGRMPALKETLHNLIKEHQPDVIQLQEGRKFDTKHGDHVDSITPLVKFLTSKGYNVSHIPHTPSLNCPPNKAFSHIVAVKNSFIIDNQYLKFFTSTPDAPTDHQDHFNGRKDEIKEHNIGIEWERSTYITKFHDADGQIYYAFNVHLGLGAFHRKTASKMLKQFVQEILDKEPHAKVVVTGDFNSFPDWAGPEQLEILRTDSPLQEVTETLTLPNGKVIDSSFIAFPYDFGADSKRLDAQIGELYDTPPVPRRAKIIELYRDECKSLGGHLDRVFQHGYEHATATLIPTPQFTGFDLSKWSQEYVKAYVLKHINDGPAFASDHQPVLAVFE